MNKRGLLAAFLFSIIWVSGSLAQLTVANILEYQLGNLPGTEPANLSTVYDQLNLAYRYEMVSVSTKIEQFQTADRQLSYTDFVQKNIRIDHEGIGLTIGNFYHLVGRGLLLRSYEIPGAVIEDIGERSRYGFYRDLEGFMASYTPGIAEFYLFRGRPLNNLASPLIQDDIRRPHLLEGGEARFYFTPISFSAAYMRDNYQGEYQEYGSLASDVSVTNDLQLSGEYAWRSGDGHRFFDLNGETPYALYLGINWLYDRFGISMEYKNYNDFLLGYNDPPALVKEHQYLLLNRSTHRIIPLNETGWQTELFYRFSNGSAINFNWAESVNDLFDNRYVFSEKFAEFSYPIHDNHDVKVFIDYGMETLFDVRDRYTGGIYLQSQLPGSWSADVDLQYQQYRLDRASVIEIENYAMIISLAKSPDFSGGIVVEYSNDPVDVPEGMEKEYWLGGNLTYQYSQVHLISLFAGKRRGGNACVSGICYEILPFEGVEIRLTSLL